MYIPGIGKEATTNNITQQQQQQRVWMRMEDYRQKL